MRTFAQKPKVTQHTESAKSTKPGWTLFGQNRDVHSILNLQRTIGNHAVQRLLQSNTQEIEVSLGTSPRFTHDFSRIQLHANSRVGIQPKLKVNAPGDKHEQEADQVVEQVLRLGGSHKDDGRNVQIQAMTAGAGQEINRGLADRLNLGKGGGNPLAQATRSFFEPRMQHNFSKVKVHTGNAVADMNRELGARAFTHGRDIYFGADQYNPASPEGKRLLAHELTHVVQQDFTGGRCLHRFPISDPTRFVDRMIEESLRNIITRFPEFALDQIETLLDGLLDIIPGDATAVVFSLSGEGGYWVGGGAGVELIYIRDQGWNVYGQLGGGFVTPGGGVSLEVGIIWDLTDPGSYTGSFIELAGSATPVSISGFFVPSSEIGSQPRGIKFGYRIGSPGVSALYEYYLELTGETALATP